MFQQTAEQTAFLEANGVACYFTGRGDKRQCELKNIHTGVVVAEAFDANESVALDLAIEEARKNQTHGTGKTPEQMEIESLRRQLEDATKGNMALAREKKKGTKKKKDDELDAE